MKLLDPVSESDSLNKLLLRLPQRYPALMIDKVTYIEPLKFLAAVKNITRNECGLSGINANNYYPGTLILESLIQATTILAVHEHLDTDYDESHNLLSSLQQVEFHKPVVAGDQLLLSIEAKTKKPYLWEFEASASTEEYVVATANIFLKCMAD